MPRGGGVVGQETKVIFGYLMARIPPSYYPERGPELLSSSVSPPSPSPLGLVSTKIPQRRRALSGRPPIWIQGAASFHHAVAATPSYVSRTVIALPQRPIPFEVVSTRPNRRSAVSTKFDLVWFCFFFFFFCFFFCFCFCL